MTPVTQAQADAFGMYLCRRFYAQVIRKDMAIEMRILATALDALSAAGVKVPVGGDFMDHYSTTLGPFVYMPPDLSPDVQIEVLAHEITHVRQFWRGGGQSALSSGLGMGWLYLTEPEARVRYEVEAYRAGLEVSFLRGVPLPALDELIFPLEGGYALGPAEVTLARELFEEAATSVAAGVVSTEVGQVATAWLRSMGLV